MYFTILDSVADLPAPVGHHDANVFPDNSGWYLIFEQFVGSKNVELLFGFCCASVCSNGVDGTDLLVQPVSTEHIDDDQDSILRNSQLPPEHPINCKSVSVLLPLYRSKVAWGIKHLTSLVNYYSVDYRPLCSCITAHQYLRPLLSHVLQSESSHVLQLKGVDLDAPETDIILHALKMLGWQPYLSVYQVNWVHDLIGDYDDYIAGRPGRLRSTLRRKTAKLWKLPNVQLTVHDGQHDLDRLLKAYQRIYDHSWKVPEPHLQFIPQLISDCAKAGHLRLGLLSIDDKPVAIHFWIVKNGTAYIYKLAHDALYDNYSPGTLLMAHMVKHVMENDSVNRLDFLSGDDAYKRDWMTLRREKYEITAFNPRSLVAQAKRLKDQHFLPFVKQLALFVIKLAK